MNRRILIALATLFIGTSLFCGSVFAQGVSITVDELPGLKGDLSKVKEYKIDKTDATFIGLSAYCKDLDNEYQLFYSVKIKGEWSEWKSFSPFTEGELIDRRSFTADPLEPHTTAIRFIASKNMLSPVHFRLFYPKRTGYLEPAMNKSADCTCATASICDRNCWCPTGDCPVDSTPTPTIPTHLIVHHSAGFNNSSDFKGVVAYYWDLHVNTNGWDDIGYNWLIDPNGVIYEGRGSKTLGAHFSCMNTGTEGICLIGNFVNQPPTAAAVASLENLLAARSCANELDPRQVTFHQSSQQDLPVISSHRDGNNSPAPNSCAVGTECPGDSLYILLPQIRMRTSAQPCLALGIQPLNSNLFSLIQNPGSQLELLMPYAGLYDISLVNAVGQQVYEASLEIKNPQHHLFETSLSSGIYLIRVSTGDQQSVLRWQKID